MRDKEEEITRQYIEMMDTRPRPRNSLSETCPEAKPAEGNDWKMAGHRP